MGFLQHALPNPLLNTLCGAGNSNWYSRVELLLCLGKPANSASSWTWPYKPGRKRQSEWCLKRRWWTDTCGKRFSPLSHTCLFVGKEICGLDFSDPWRHLTVSGCCFVSAVVCFSFILLIFFKLYICKMLQIHHLVKKILILYFSYKVVHCVWLKCTSLSLCITLQDEQETVDIVLYREQTSGWSSVLSIPLCLQQCRKSLEVK